MLPTIILNTIAAFATVALTSGVALHDSRLDAAFMSAVAPAGDTASHDIGHAVSHEFHIHGSRQALTGDPVQSGRSHRRHTAQPHARLRLSALTA